MTHDLHDFGERLNPVRDALVAKIRACFPVTPVPPYPKHGFVYGPSGDEYRGFAGKPWTEIPRSLLNGNYDIDPRNGLSPELRNYYLPAFLVRELAYNDVHQRSIWYLGSEDKDQAAANLLLTSAQKMCIEEFLAFWRDLETSGYLL